MKMPVYILYRYNVKDSPGDKPPGGYQALFPKFLLIVTAVSYHRNYHPPKQKDTVRLQ
jgi:hypothetical protein